VGLFYSAPESRLYWLNLPHIGQTVQNTHTYKGMLIVTYTRPTPLCNFE